MINSYLYHSLSMTKANQSKKVISHQVSIKKQLSTVKVPATSFTHSLQQPAKTNLQKQQPKTASLQADKTAAEKAIAGQQQDTLLRLLHEAIQKQQQYPPSALQMGREGKVIIEFTLYKDGTISNLTVAQPCATPSLNQAALQAVEAAAPFKNAANYLTKTKTFRIELVFELPAEKDYNF